MSVYSFRMSLAAPGHSVQAPFSQPGHAGGKVGSQRGVNDLLDEDDEPNASDLETVLGNVKKDKKCAIYWYPDKGTHSFQPLKGGKVSIVSFLLFLDIRDKKDSAEALWAYQATLKGAKVTDVVKDSRMGYEVVKIDLESLDWERK